MYCSDVAHASGGDHRRRFDPLEPCRPIAKGCPRHEHERRARVAAIQRCNGNQAVASWLEPAGVPHQRGSGCPKKKKSVMRGVMSKAENERASQPLSSNGIVSMLRAFPTASSKNLRVRQMKRVTTVNRWCVLFAAGGLLSVAACVDEGPEAPPLPGAPGSTAPPEDGGAQGGTGGAAGAAGSAGSAGTAGSAGSAGSAGAAGAAGAGDAGSDIDAGSDGG